MDELEIKPLLRPFEASVRVPGSKSITNRALLLAAMADGPSRIDEALFSDDTHYMIGALRRLGFMISADEAHHSIGFEGRGGKIPAHGADLFVGNAGTAMRFLAGFVTLGQGRFRIDGNARMRERPIGELLDALCGLGIDARSEVGNGCPPIVIESSGDFAGGETTVDARGSSQFVSALLLPAPYWRNGLRLVVRGEAGRPFIEMTAKLMERWGVHSDADERGIAIPGRQRYRARHFVVEADASSASYFAAAAALCGGAVTLRNLSRDSLQGDLGFLDLLERIGARIAWDEHQVTVIGGGRLRGLDLDMHEMPDMVPTLAVLAPFADTPTRIRNVAFIRRHESDRLSVLAAELSRMGAVVTEFDDGLLIAPSTLRPASIRTHDDHRIAMSFAVAGLKLPGVRIQDPGCVSKTYPDFFVDLARLG